MNLVAILIKKIIPIFIIALCFSACKKQKITEASVQFSSPLSNQKFTPNSQVQLQATVTDEENIMLVSWFVLGPDGDTAISSGVPEIDKNKIYTIDYDFNHGVDYFSTGVFTWHITVANKFKTFYFSRSFQIGEVQNIESDFAILNVQRNYYPIKVFMYDRSLTKYKSYNLSYDTRNIAAFGSKIYSFDGNELVMRDGFTGKNKKSILTSSTSSINFNVNNQLYVSSYQIPPQVTSFDKSGNSRLIIQNQFGKLLNVFSEGDFIYTVEFNRSTGTKRLVMYEKATGAYRSSIILQNNLEVYGLFSFGNQNRIYIMTQDPTNSSQTVFWYFNQSANSLSKLTATIYSRVRGSQNPIITKDNKVWIFTSYGLFEYTSDDQVTRISISTSAQDLTQVTYYNYSKKENLLIYQIEDNYYIYDLTTKKEIGKINNNRNIYTLGEVFFIEK